MDVTDVAHFPLPGTVVPARITFAPDGSSVTWLHSEGGDLARQLYAFDLDAGTRRLLVGGGVREEDLSLDEKLRRERTRDLAVGVTSYAWSREGGVLLIPLPDGLHAGRGDDLRLVVPARDGDAPMLDPRLSDDGAFVAWVQDAEIHVVATSGDAEPRQLTSGARDAGRTHGLADFISQEEMDQARGFWWSPDGARIAFLEVDESHIPVLRLPHADGTHEDHRYPFAGAANPIVRLGLVSVEGGDATWVDLGDHEYIARVDWFDRDRLVVQVEDRLQRRLEVLLVDGATGAVRCLFAETSDVWINLHDHFRPIDGDRFLWASERSGFMHLEVRSIADGSCITEVTSGNWMVTATHAVDATRVWFSATLDSPLERHLYVAPLTGGPPRRLTDAGGYLHDVVLDVDRGRFVETWSSLSQPPVVRLRSLDTGSVVRTLHDEVDPRVAALDLRPPTLTTALADDGVTELHVALYEPRDRAAPHPTVVSVYGGPHAQMVTRSWGMTSRMRAQYLRELGYLVVVVDNRGSAGRGLEFESAIRHRTGEVEVRDQVAALRSLAERGTVDLARGVAVNGWSYGGYMSAMCLAKAPDVFAAAVAGAPVTHWDGYDTHYTERYMGTPQDNRDGYERSSVMAHVEGMRGRHLMLVHGMIDENVHFRHTARLVNGLTKARIPYRLLLFPDERHLPRAEADRVFMEEQIRDFVLAHVPVE